MSVLKNVLQTNNAHIRDKNIKFYNLTVDNMSGLLAREVFSSLKLSNS